MKSDLKHSKSQENTASTNQRTNRYDVCFAAHRPPWRDGDQSRRQVIQICAHLLAHLVGRARSRARDPVTTRARARKRFNVR